MRGWKRKSLGGFPPFLFVLSLSLFLLLSTVLSSLCSWEPLTLPLTNTNVQATPSSMHGIKVLYNVHRNVSV